MTSTFAIARIRGVEVRVHWSWILILALVTVSLATEVLPRQNGTLPAIGLWIVAVATSLLSLVSVVLHELAHVAIARRNGIDGHAVTIQLLGGTYTLECRPVAPGQQLRLAAVGPLVSIVLAVIFGVVGVAVSAAGWGNVLATAAFILADWNLFVALVNLLPGYPLDGASIVRSVIWRTSGREDRATALTGRIGRMLGFAMVGLAFVIFIFFDSVLAVFVGLAGWLLTAGGSAVERREFLRNLVSGLRVGDAIEDAIARVPPQLTLDTFATDYLAESGTAVVVERPDEPLGIVGAMQARRNRRRWSTLHAADVMTPMAQVPAVAPDTELWPVLEQLERSGLDALVVDRPGEPATFLTRRSAARAVHARAQARVQAAIVLGQMQGQLRGRRPGSFWGRRSGGSFRGPEPFVPPPTSGPQASDDDASQSDRRDDPPDGSGSDRPGA